MQLLDRTKKWTPWAISTWATWHLLSSLQSPKLATPPAPKGGLPLGLPLGILESKSGNLGSQEVFGNHGIIQCDWKSLKIAGIGLGEKLTKQHWMRLDYVDLGVRDFQLFISSSNTCACYLHERLTKIKIRRGSMSMGSVGHTGCGSNVKQRRATLARVVSFFYPLECYHENHGLWFELNLRQSTIINHHQPIFAILCCFHVAHRFFC